MCSAAAVCAATASAAAATEATAAATSTVTPSTATLAVTASSTATVARDAAVFAGAAASSPVSRGLPAIQRELGASGPIVAQRAHGVWVELRPEQRCGQPSNGRPQPGRRVVVPI